jgi:exopolysaccharide biosynthesis polyprenyl glycosylphosphotransferase
MDLTILVAARAGLGFLRELTSTSSTATLLFPPGFMGGWGSLAAFVVGLTFAGAYGSEERWMRSSLVLRGVAFGAALALWQSIDSAGLGWTILRWTAVVSPLGLALALGRAALGAIVVRYRIAAKPTDRVILVGDPLSPAGKTATERVVTRPGMRSLGWLSERGDVKDYLGHPSAVWEVLCETGTDTVILCGDVHPSMFDAVVEAAAVAGCRVLSIRPHSTMMAIQPKAIGVEKIRMLELTFPAGRAGRDAVKRLFDAIGSLLLILLLSPVLAAISIWIRLDSKGPVIFVQQRVGRAGALFPMWKFRTMSDGADAQKESLAHLNQSGDPRLFKIPGDPRVTSAGSVLRRWSLDELPQLFNVLRGHMSLVGPRPFFESDLAAYDDHHFIRLTVKPGVTGLWQVKGRSSIVDFEEVIELDREYVESWSLGLDLKILSVTLPAVLRRTGAF